MSDNQVTITPLKNGPVLVQGPVRIIGAGGGELQHGEPAALCRCGHSANKPFCDGSHKRVGFEAPGFEAS